MPALAVASALFAGATAGLSKDISEDVPSNRQPATELERVIGQLILVGFKGTRPQDEGVRAVSAQLAEGRIGGVAIMARNVVNARQFRTLTDHLKNLPENDPAFIAVDQEGGKVQRLSGLPGMNSWVRAGWLPGKTGNCDPEASEAYYDKRAARMPGYGINLNFGPVVDINVNPRNPVIGRLGRSYSANADTVSRCAEGFVRAHRAAGVLTALKHFPGHGSSHKDSHHDLPVIDKGWTETELAPFRNLAEDKLTDMVMMGHVVHARFSDEPDLPASLSRRGVAAARAIAGEDAVIITDCLEMDAIEKRFSFEEAGVRALAAGNDMVLLTSFERFDPGLGDRINAAIRDAVEDGRLSLERLERSAERVRNLKARLRAE